MKSFAVSFVPQSTLLFTAKASCVLVCNLEILILLAVVCGHLIELNEI